MKNKTKTRAKKEVPVNLEGEFWTDITDFKDWYSCSNTGRIKSMERIIKYSNGGIRKTPSLLIKGSISKNGYLGVALRKSGIVKYFSIHRLVALTLIPNPENKPYVNHKDGNKLNNRVDNLEWSTCQENTKHAWDNGLCTIPLGELNNSSKLTESQVLEIRKLKGLDTHLSISKKYGVSQATISNILNRKIWTHI